MAIMQPNSTWVMQLILILYSGNSLHVVVHHSPPLPYIPPRETATSSARKNENISYTSLLDPLGGGGRLIPAFTYRHDRLSMKSM